MHPHSTTRLFDELTQLPDAVRAQVLEQLKALPQAALLQRSLETFWGNHRVEL